MKKISRKNIIIFSGTIIVIVLVLFFSSDNSQPQNSRPASIVKIQTEEQEVITEESVPKQEIRQTTETFYPVIKVVDGDTLSVNIDGQTQTLRLIGIDTPETVHPSKPVECFGIEASNKAKQILDGRSIRIEKDTTQGDYDKYNRLLAYVFLEDGTNFNKMMIEEGYGYEYTYDLPYKYQSEFKQAEEQAKTLKKGLWANNACQEEITQTQTVSTPEPTAKTTTKPAKSDCSSNVYNCTDFATHAEAQATYEYCGGVNNDIHKLDRDNDGQSCESLP